MLAYRARTLAFSRMASSDGVVSVIFSTERHLAKSAPSFLYCAQRSESPSRPAQNPPSDTRQRGLYGNVVLLSFTYPEWWSLRWFRRGERHLCPPGRRGIRHNVGNHVVRVMSCSQDFLMLTFPNNREEMGEKGFCVFCTLVLEKVAEYYKTQRTDTTDCF